MLSSVCRLAAMDSELALFPVRTSWSASLDADLAASPVYDESIGFFLLVNDQLVAYNLNNGSVQWTANVRSSSPLAVGDGLVFVKEDVGLAAFRARDGGIAWRTPLPEMLASPLVWDNGWLIVTTQSSEAMAFRASDGQKLWQRVLGSPAVVAPSLAADRVYFPLSDHRVVALQVEGGMPAWERILSGSPTTLLALDERVYAGTEDNFFYCLVAGDGRVDWRWRTGGDVVGRPAVDARRVYFVALDNVLRSIDRNSGVQHWKRNLPLRPVRGPLVAGDVILVSGIGSVLPTFDAANGRPSGAINATGDVIAAPHVFDASGLPAVLVVTRDVATAGVSLTVVVRQIEPVLGPVTPLPDPVIPPLPASQT